MTDLPTKTLLALPQKRYRVLVEVRAQDLQTATLKAKVLCRGYDLISVNPYKGDEE